jgi:hypothetical protein
MEYFYAIDTGAGATMGLDMVRGPFESEAKARRESHGNRKAGNLRGIFVCPSSVGDGTSFAELLKNSVAHWC